jgi:hypothetical protein
MPPQPDPVPTLRHHLSQGGYAALLTDHCQLVEQSENLVVVVIQLWEMNNAMREARQLPRASPCRAPRAWRARRSARGRAQGGPPCSRRPNRALSRAILKNPVRVDITFLIYRQYDKIMTRSKRIGK